MGRVYKQGIGSPKGFDMVQAEPVDQRTIVEYKTDLTTINKAYPGLKVQVLESIDGMILREFKFMGGSYSDLNNWTEVTGGSGGGTLPSELPLKFTSFVFVRNVGAPSTPVGGDYDDPVPPGWSDMVPSGTDPVWMSSAVFTQGEATPPVWTSPILTEDTEYTDFEYCTFDDPNMELDPNGKPAPPLEGAGQRVYWHNDPTVTDDWMAIGRKIGGAYPESWDVVKIGGEKGADGGPGPEGRAYRESIVFTRSNLDGMDRAVVKGGGFNSPTPTDTSIDGNAVSVIWHDGIPLGGEKVWMSKFTFNDVDHQSSSLSNEWTTPSNITDTATDDFEFSDSLAEPADPDTAPNLWHNIATSNDIWMAHRSIKNGEISPWGITRIKGETGAAGQGLNIKGRDTIANILAMTSPPVELYDIWLANNDDATAVVPGVVNDAYIFVGGTAGDNGTAWDNIGPVTGTDGMSFKQSFVFKRSATQPATPTGGTFADPIPTGWSDGIPNGTDQIWATNRFFSNPDSTLADWKAPYLAQDTIDFDFKYADKQINDGTPLPPHQAPGGVWYETPLPNSYWMAKGKKTNGVVDDATWEVLRIKGEKGDTGADGIPSFLASAYFKTNDDISSANVTGGTYASPVPTSQIGGVNWSDGIPTGPGAIWFTQVRFDQSDDGSVTKVWPSPSIVADSTTVEYQFSGSLSKPTGYPVEGNDGANSWYDDADSVTGNVIWMAIGSLKNGVWPTTWDIVKVIGENGQPGQDGRTYIPSTRFCRSDAAGMDQIEVVGQYLVDNNGVYEITGDDPATVSPIGGHTYTFSDNIPPVSDTFPNNAKQVWMIQAVFNSIDNLGPGNEMNWGTPSLLADSGGMDYQYHGGDGSGGAGARPSNPVGPAGSNPDANGWYDTPDLVPGGAFWLAQRNWSEGPAAQWVVYQIRGEDGQAGDTGLPPAKVTGVVATPNGKSALKLTWNVPTDPEGDLEGYEVNNITAAILSNTLTNQISLYNLEGTSAQFKIRAYDAAGNKGEWSDIVTASVPDYWTNSLAAAVPATTHCTTGTLDSTIYAKLTVVPQPGYPMAVGDYIYSDSQLTTPVFGKAEVYGPPGEPNWIISTDNSTGKVTSIDECINI